MKTKGTKRGPLSVSIRVHLRLNQIRVNQTVSNRYCIAGLILLTSLALNIK